MSDDGTEEAENDIGFIVETGLDTGRDNVLDTAEQLENGTELVVVGETSDDTDKDSLSNVINELENGDDPGAETGVDTERDTLPGTNEPVGVIILGAETSSAIDRNNLHNVVNELENVGYLDAVTGDNVYHNVHNIIDEPEIGHDLVVVTEGDIDHVNLPNDMDDPESGNDLSAVTNDDIVTSEDTDSDNLANELTSKNSIELKELIPFYGKYKNCLKVGHININSVRHKFDPLHEALSNGILDILFIQETKLDCTFPKKQFDVPGFKSYRQDYTATMGGIMMFIREDLPHRRRDDLESNDDSNGRIEMLVLEVTIKSETWLFTSIYNQPNFRVSDFCVSIETHINKCKNVCPNLVIVGDINIDFLKRNVINDILDVHGMKNIVTNPTCYKGKNPSCIDVVMSNVYKRLQGVFCYDTGLSDFHRMVLFATKIHVPCRKPKKLMYRSYKNFNEIMYYKDLLSAPFHVGEIFDSIDDSYWFCEQLWTGIMNEHAPLKRKTVRHAQVPYMNGELRKAINYKNMLRRKFERNKSSVNWQHYRKHRNYVVRLRKISKSRYLKEKCTVSKDKNLFWNVVKPLISDKCKGGQENIILSTNDTIINEPLSVCNEFNEFYNGVAADIGQNPSDIADLKNDDDFDVYLNEVLRQYSDHPSMSIIRDNTSYVNTFCFAKVSVDEIRRRLANLNSRKSPGYDGIPVKLVKLGADVLCYPVQQLVNKCIELSLFPTALKRAEITPIFKKGDNLKKENYRPVSVLPCVSKIFEGVIIDQLTQYFESHLSPHVSGFRKHHDCQSVLLRFVERIKSHLDKNEIAGAVLTDLSKAFDCLPHGLLICKMFHYGIDRFSCKLIASYFKDRHHRVKLGSVRSDWLPLIKGAPQGSILGPFTYNVHCNDLIIFLSLLCDIFNYADDNTVSCYGKNLSDVKLELENVTAEMLNWFKINEMKVNNEKFQLILFSKKGKTRDEFIMMEDDRVIEDQPVVKLLGVHCDNVLTFDRQIDEMCRKAGNKLNVLGRLSKSLDAESKLILFHSFILSHFEYCATVWHFCSREKMRKIEKIQKQALRHVFNDYTSSYADLLKRADRTLMYVQRLRSILKLVYKCLNKEGPAYLHDMFTLNEGSNSRKGSQLIQPKFSTIKYGFNSVRYQGSRWWNLLDNNFKVNTNFKKWEPQCTCTTCDLCILMQV